MSSSILEGDPLVKDLIFCKLCSKFFEDPRVLPCQHTFCLRCLQDQFKTSHAGTRTRLNSLRCPQCYTTAAIPLRGIHMFPEDQKVEKIKQLVETSLMSGIIRKSRLDLLESYKRGGKSRPSSWTGNIDVTELAGAGGALNNTFPKAEPQSTAKESMLPPETKEVSTDTGEDSGENNCVVNNHQEVNSINLEECGIQTDLCDVTKYVGYEVVLADNAVDGQSARKRTSNARINQNGGVPLSKRTCPSSATKNLHHKLPNCDKDHKLISEEEGSSGLANGEFEVNGDTLSSVSNDKANDENTVHKEANTRSNDNDGTNNLGEDQVDFTSAENMASEDNNTRHIEQDDETDSVEHSEEPIKVYTEPPELLWKLETQEYNMPTSIAATSNGNVIVAEYGNCKLQMFEKDGTYMLALDDVKPYSVAITGNDEFVVADRKDKTIKVYGEIGDFKYSWDKESFHWISGLGVNSEGNFIIFDREDCKVGIFSPEGERISQFGHYGDGDSHLCMADFLTVDAHNRILICDSGHHCIKIYDSKGSFLGKFGERGTSEGHLLWPKSVCVDAANNILVTDQKNNRVSLYSSDGVFIQTLISSYNSPYGLCYTSPDILGLTSFNLSGSATVSLYKL